ncbi:MAG: protein kinase family protein [Lentisphaerae bacterium]|nr:protein kinase family protein [Lentisphaerota bacterium]
MNDMEPPDTGSGDIKTDSDTKAATKPVLMHKGRYGNAILWKTEKNGKAMVRKDFSEHNFFIRNTLGRFFISREFYFLKKVESSGIVPGWVEREGKFTLIEEFCDGETLRDKEWGDSKEERAAANTFFHAFEEGIKKIHEMEIVHLDLRNLRNVMCSSTGNVFVIDWESALSTRFMPPPLKRLLRSIDIAGVYKMWSVHSPETMGEARIRHLDKINRIRHLWVPRGYPILSFRQWLAKKMKKRQQ